MSRPRWPAASGGAPAEIDAPRAPPRAAEGEGWTGTDFSLCDDAASGMMRGHLRRPRPAHRPRPTGPAPSRPCRPRWSPAERAAFAPLRRAEAAFVDARGQGEVDQSGSGRGRLRGARPRRRPSGPSRELLADAEAGRIAPASAADAKAAQEVLDASFAGLMARVPGLARTTSITAAGLVSSQRSWLRYRDAWLSFARVPLFDPRARSSADPLDPGPCRSSIGHPVGC